MPPSTTAVNPMTPVVFPTEAPQSAVSVRMPFDRQQFVEFVKRKYNTGFKANSLDYERFSRYYKLVRNKQVQKNYLGLANLFVPEPYRIIRKKTAKLSQAVKAIKVVDEEGRAQEAAKMGTALMAFLRRKMDWHMQERTAIQESRIIGLSWLKMVWNLDKEEMDKPWKGFDLSFHTADEIILNPEATINDVFEGNIRYLIHVYEADIDTLKRNPNYSAEDIRILQARGGSAKNDRSPLEMARLNFVHQNKNKETRTKKFKIFEYWGKFNPNNPDETQSSDSLEEDYLIVIADNSVVLRGEINPYRQILDNPVPFVPVVANPIGRELYPVGDIEPAESLFNELNDTRNQRMDTVTLNIDPPKEVLRSAGIDEKELVARRGWYWKSNVPNGVRFIPPALQGVEAAIEEEKVIRSDIQQVTNILDFNQGSDVAAGISIDTARGAIIAKGEADEITADDIELLKVSLRMLYRIALAYAKVFLDRKFAVSFKQKGVEQFYAIDRTSLQGNIDLDVEMETLQDKTTQQQLKLMLFNQAKTIPGANIGKFFTDLLEAFFENVNIDEYYQQPQPQPQQPKVSISLKGDLNPIESDEIYKSMGLDPSAADPLYRKEMREAMAGNLPEHKEKDMHRLDVLGKQRDILASFDQQKKEENAAGSTSANQ